MKKPTVINVVIDGITITFNDPDNSVQYVNRIKELSEKHGRSNLMKGYNYGCSFKVNEGCFLDVMCRRDGRVKITWNPARTSMMDCTLIRAFLLDVVGPYFDRLWENKGVCRLDVAVDISNLSPDDFFFEKKYSKKTHVISSNQGVTETVYLGGKKPTTAIYNKSEELRANYGRKKSTSTKIQIPQKPIVRIEERLRKKQFSPKDLVDGGGQPFKGFKAYALSEVAHLQGIPLLLIDSFHHRGINPAISRLPKHRRKNMKKLMRKADVTSRLLGGIKNEIKRAYMHLMLLAPEGEWFEYYEKLPEELHYYCHTGIITVNLLESMGCADNRPNDRQLSILGKSCSKEHWRDKLLGRAVRWADSEKLCLAATAEES